jgi:DNA-binding response OmpR family regulator
MERPTILISDDEPRIASAIARQAKQAGMSFIVDTTSEHVIDLAKTHRPSVIILDVHQRNDGRDILKRLKADPETRDIKVIVLSAAGDEFTRRLCLELGAEDYVEKPMEVTFITKVARLANIDPTTLPILDAVGC